MLHILFRQNSKKKKKKKRISDKFFSSFAESFRFHFRSRTDQKRSEILLKIIPTRGTALLPEERVIISILVEKTFPLASSFLSLLAFPRLNIRFRLRRDTNCANANPCRGTFENSASGDWPQIARV